MCNLLLGSSTQPRTTETCGDPSLATTYYEAFESAFAVHGINTMATFVNAEAFGGQWQIKRPSYKAWTEPGQPSTTPFYAFLSPTNKLVYVASNDGSAPPPPSGFQNPPVLAGYVYLTQICGSIPLYGAAATTGDHWYTTDLLEHNELIVEPNWTDVGIAAYVLPIDGTFVSLPGQMAHAEIVLTDCSSSCS
jgi:hypothetical protein